MQATSAKAAARSSRQNALWLAAITISACQTNPLIEAYNEPPVADAKILKMGMPVEQARDGSIADLVFPYAGEPVAITLDGSSSRDANGKVVGYRWLSGARAPDAGLPAPWRPDASPPLPALRMQPAGVEGGIEGVSPTIMVGAGVWAFSLFVVDDQGAWSSPDTIRFIVGDPPPAPRDGGAGDAGPQDAGADADAEASADAAPLADAALNGDAAPVADAGTRGDAAPTDADSAVDAGDAGNP